MNFSHFFIRRPIFAAVLSIVIVLVGGIAVFQLPIAQYPEIAPPTVVVRAVYPGANPKVLAETVATPIEQEVNGVENMLYMSSTSTSDGVMSLTITFKLGTDLNTAQVLVQNRVSIALPKLPEEVRRIGVTTTKRSSDLTMVAHLVSPDSSRDELYLGNYAFLQVKDQLARIQGVGDVTVFGARDYSMRIWLDPENLASRNMTASDVVRAIREQNLQVAAGTIGQPPVPSGQDFQLTISTQGRLLDEQQFGDIIVKQGSQGQVTRIRDVARVELAARDYSIASQLSGKAAAALVIWQLPGSNAIDTSDAVRAKLAELKKNFPPGVDYRVIYDTTLFARESIRAVMHTLFEAVLLVVLVVIVFLQNWRSASNAEMFPAGFRALGLGKVVGTPTMGAVIGTGSYSLIDGSTVRTPGVGVFLADSKRTNMENYGVQPDMLVDNSPEDTLAGRDRQLEVAVEELMKQLQGPKRPRRLIGPVRRRRIASSIAMPAVFMRSE